MQNPFRSPNTWIRATAISAAILTISLGLCGANLAAFSHYHLGVSGGRVPGRAFEENLSTFLIPLGMLEALGMLVGAVALLVSLLGLLISAALRRTNHP